MQLDGPHADKATAVRSALLLNAAACQLRLEDWHGAIGHCSEVSILAQASQVSAAAERGVWFVSPCDAVRCEVCSLHERRVAGTGVHCSQGH